MNKPKSFWKKLVVSMEVQPKGDLSTAQMFLYNHDLRPVEEARRVGVVQLRILLDC